MTGKKKSDQRVHDATVWMIQKKLALIEEMKASTPPQIDEEHYRQMKQEYEAQLKKLNG